MAEEAVQLLDEALEWLAGAYREVTFFAERDIVWTVQCRLLERVAERGLPLQVFNDYPILPGNRRSLSADLAIRSPGGPVHVAAEFKYEPSHARKDILPGKFPVVFWGKDGVGKDVDRVREFVEKGAAQVAYSIFIDEGGHFRHRDPHTGSTWAHWPSGPWALLSRVPPGG